MEAAVSDFHRIQHEFSEKSGHLKDVKAKIGFLTAELEALKEKYNDADFNFKKFDVSSEVVETMIEKQLKFKNQKTKGLGYGQVPPPFNDNYTSPLKPKEQLISICMTKSCLLKLRLNHQAQLRIKM